MDKKLLKTVALGTMGWGLLSALWNRVRENEYPELKFKVLKREMHNKNGTVNYILPGFCRPPLDVFMPYVDEMYGDVLFADYGHNIWQTEAFKDQLIEDMERRGYKRVRVFAISIGCMLINKPQDYTDGKLEIFYINPVRNVHELWANLSHFVDKAMPYFVIGRKILGPIADIPMLPVDHVFHSYNELLSQSMAPMLSENFDIYHKGVNIVLSNLDKIEDPTIIKMEVDDCEVECINTTHANIRETEEYIPALRRLGAFDT